MWFYLYIQHKIKLYTVNTMVAATKEDASDGAHGEGSNEKKVIQGNKALNKKGPRNGNSEKKYQGFQTY